MVVLDGSIVNIALPSIQTDLGVSASSLAWVVNAYALAFGGLLLLGGKSGDLYGRRRMFRVGVAIFVIASALGGFATNEGWLIGARILQGIGGAIAAPTALSLIAVNFREGKARNRAMGVYAAMAGVGATIGLLLGGVLTDYLSWRWVFFVNVPIGIAVLLGTSVLAEGGRNDGRLDVPGAVLGTGGLLALVYAITRGGESGWTDDITVACLVASVVLLVVFVGWQARSHHPMMPLWLFSDRSRAGSYATVLFIGAGMFATFYFLTLFLQQILGYSPIKAGFAYLPFSVGIGWALPSVPSWSSGCTSVDRWPRSSDRGGRNVLAQPSQSGTELLRSIDACNVRHRVRPGTQLRPDDARCGQQGRRPKLRYRLRIAEHRTADWWRARAGDLVGSRDDYVESPTSRCGRHAVPRIWDARPRADQVG